MQIGLIANINKPSAKERIQEFRESFHQYGIECLLESETAKLLEEKGKPLSTLGENLSIIISLGGDGTLLEVSKQLRQKKILLAGVNIGNVGFLSTSCFSEKEILAKAIKEKSYQQIQRSFLKIDIHHKQTESFYSLNEAVFSRGGISRLIELEVKINGEFFNRYRSDGLIIATPTGSTAYSLSAGGPIIHPHSQALLVNPICPYTLEQRSLVLNDDAIIEIKSHNKQRPVLISFDGYLSKEFSQEATAYIQKAESALSFMQIGKKSFFQTLQEKFSLEKK